MPQGVVCRQGRRWENHSSLENKEVSECVQTYLLYRLCHRVVFAGKERYGKINQVQTTKRSVSVYKLTSCIECATEVLFTGKDRDGQINQVQTTKRSVSLYKLTSCIEYAAGCCFQARKEMGKSIKFRQQSGQ